MAHDYRQKAELIYELESLFKTNDFKNEEYFPEYIVVRKQKFDFKEVETLKNYIKTIKTMLKE